MVILRSQNKITDIFKTLAWASPFKHDSLVRQIFVHIFLKLLVNEIPPDYDSPISRLYTTCQKYNLLDFENYYVVFNTTITSSLGQSYASAYRRCLAVSSRPTTISYSVNVVILVVCLRFKPYWMFQISKYVIKCREELTSCSSILHSHMFPLLDVLYRQVGNLSFGQLK